MYYIEIWHYWVEISNVEEMLDCNEYLFHENNIQAIAQKYVQDMIEIEDIFRLGF